MGRGGCVAAETDGGESEEGGVALYVLMPSLPRWELGRILRIFIFHSL